MKNQMVFDFIEVMDREQAEEADRNRLYRQKRNADAILKHMVDDLPPVDAEIDVISMGIRMARHVHDDECRKCNLGTQNHCPDVLPAHWYHGQYCRTKVCLKDYFRFCTRIGRKDLIRKQMRL